MCVCVSVSPRIRYKPGAKAFSIPPSPEPYVCNCCVLLRWSVDAFEFLSVRPRLEDDSG